MEDEHQKRIKELEHVISSHMNELMRLTHLHVTMHEHFKNIPNDRQVAFKTMLQSISYEIMIEELEKAHVSSKESHNYMNANAYVFMLEAMTELLDETNVAMQTIAMVGSWKNRHGKEKEDG